MNDATIAIAGAPRRAARVPGLLARVDPVLAALVGLAFVVYALTSILRHDHFASGGFDLGIFDQTVWHWSRFELPASSIENLPNVLGDHFSPGLAVLAPLYWLWDDARMLLLAQAALVAGAAVPIHAFCRPRVGRAGARLLAGAYLAFGGVTAAIAFDFHEVALAPPLIAGALLAFDRDRMGIGLGCVLGLLLVKEDLSLLVVAFGVYLLTLGHRRAAAACVVGGLGWFAVITGVVMPGVARGRFNYWSYDAFGRNLPAAVVGVLERPWRLVTVAVDHTLKVHTLLRTLGPWLGLIVLTRVGILALPLLGERLWSSTANYWSPGFHYALTISPVLACGSADALAGLRRRGPLAGVLSRPRAVPATCALILVLSLATAQPNLLAALTHRSTYARPAPLAGLAGALALIPPGASVATQDSLVAHLAHRQTVAEISAKTGTTDWVVVDPFRAFGTLAPNGGFDVLRAWLVAHNAQYRIVYAAGEWIVLRLR